MRVGKLRIELSKILTEVMGNEYPPEGIRQSNVTVGLRSRCWSDPHYFIANPKHHGECLASPYTMRQVIDAHKRGLAIEISSVGTIIIS